MNEGHPLRVGVWCAVSSQAQAADDKVSLEDQETSGRDFAQALGGQVVAVYRVPGHTRDLIFYTDAEAAMPAYRDLHADVEADRLDVLWALDVDRLGRDPALGAQVLSLVEKHDAEVYLASAPHVVGQKTVAHRYITAIQSVRAGEDQALRQRRLRSGMRGRIEKRGLLPGSLPFYLDPVRDQQGDVVGYQFNNQAASLDTMTDLFLAGHSYAEIARRLNASPQPPPRGQRWWHYSILKFLHSDVPAGFAQWGDYRSPRPSPHIPKRWDKATFAAVVRERQRRARPGLHRQGSSAYAGVALCARCGSQMTIARQAHYLTTGPKLYTNLRCGRHALRSIYADFECHPNYIPEEVVTAKLSDFFARFLADPAKLDEALAHLGERGETQRLAAELERAQSTAEDLDHQRLRLAHALAAGQLDPALYRQVDDELLAQLDAAQQNAHRLAQSLDALPDRDQVRAALLHLALNFLDLAAGADPAELSAILQTVPIRVWCENGQVIRIDAG